jgi:autotransporter-associated beta strand protein
VSLTTVLRPNGITVDNTAKNYTFAGTGRITGSTALIKNGTGTLSIRNSGANDFIGGVTINAGAVEIGDGVTSGAGTLGVGLITNHGTLILNRPDNFTLTNLPLNGLGGLTKNGAGTASFPAAVNQSGRSSSMPAAFLLAGEGL